LWAKSLLPLLPFQAIALATAPTRAARAGRGALGIATALLVAWLVVDLWVQARFGAHVASYLPFIGAAIVDREHAQWVGDPLALAASLAKLLAATALACAALSLALRTAARSLFSSLSPARARGVAAAATLLYVGGVGGAVLAQRALLPDDLRQRLALVLPYDVADAATRAGDEEGGVRILGLVPWPWESAEHVELLLRNPAAAPASLDGYSFENERGQRVALAGVVEAGQTRSIEVARSVLDLSREASSVVLRDASGREVDRAAYRGEDVKRGAALWFPPPAGASAGALRRIEEAASATWLRWRDRIVAPRTPALAPGARRAGEPPDVVVLIAESLRADAVSPDGLAGVDRLGREGLRAQRHYAGSNSSHRGLFALLHARHPLVYDAVLDGGATPAAIALFRELGYRTALVSSGEIEAWKRMDRFLGAPPFDEIDLHVAERAPLWKEWPDCDRRTLAAIRERIARPGPDFVVGFLMTTHFPYPYPPAFERHLPVSQEDELLSWGQLYAAPLDREKLHNRYRNAALALDAMLVEFTASLDRDGTVLAITGDHGESFGEDGALLHGSRASDAQSRVPLIVLAPDLAPREIDAPTSHVDLLPTLLHLATATPDPAQGVDGRDLLGATPPADGVLVAPYRLTQPEELLWVHGDRRVLFRVRTDRPELRAFAFVDERGAPLVAAEAALLLESETLAARIGVEIERLAGTPPASQH